MAEEKLRRISQVARELNIGTATISDFLGSKGFAVDSSPNAKITEDQYQVLLKEFQSSAEIKKEASGLKIGQKHDDLVAPSDGVPKKTAKEEEDEATRSISPEELKKTIAIEKEEDTAKAESVTKSKLTGIKVLGKIDLTPKKTAPKGTKPAGEDKQEKKSEPKAAPPKEEKPKEEAPVETEEKKAEDVPQVQVKAPEPPPAEPEPTPMPEEEAPKEQEVIRAKADRLSGVKVLGTIQLPTPAERPKKKTDAESEADKKKRKRVKVNPGGQQVAPFQNFRGGHSNQTGGGPQGRTGRPGQQRTPDKPKVELTDEEIKKQIKDTLARLSGGKSTQPTSKRSKYRKEKRSAIAEAAEERMLKDQEDQKVLKVTEFVSANDLASLMNVTVTDIITVCMNLGMVVSINQRLDAEAITIIADEFGYDVKFQSSEEEEELIKEEEDDEGDLTSRAPIVTIMGHVDHGKTSLLDYIRKTNVTAGEAGGITQHIGAYDVTTETGKRIAFLDTPGHEAFTAMRARGAKVTDVVILVVAADDRVMPQTKEAINHAQVAGVPIVIALNKTDKPSANPEKIKEELANLNILVEDWGGKYQCEQVSAKTGLGIQSLLEKVLLEAELLDLKANPDRNAMGTVIEASLDRGRGYVTTVLVQNGTLNVGDVILAGAHYGKVKAMMDHTGKRLKSAPPSTPVQILGIDGAPQAGEKFNVMDSEREAREIANKREQIQREQSIRTRKHITLDEIGRRLAIGNFKELNVIVKGDVDGSVEALSDSLLKLSTEEIQVRIIHKGVGQISESDVLLASASDAIVIGFQVRPSQNARKVAENEEIEIRLYSIIYDAINEVKAAMEGMLAPTIEEVITGNIDVREVFKITKVGTVAGCYVTDGVIKRANQIRVVRDGIVIYTGKIGQLKRFKDDVAEVKSGFECGLSIESFNDLQVGDVIEGFENRETKRTL